MAALPSAFRRHVLERRAARPDDGHHAASGAGGGAGAGDARVDARALGQTGFIDDSEQVHSRGQRCVGKDELPSNKPGHRQRRIPGSGRGRQQSVTHERMRRVEKRHHLARRVPQPLRQSKRGLPAPWIVRAGRDHASGSAVHERKQRQRENEAFHGIELEGGDHPAERSAWCLHRLVVALRRRRDEIAQVLRGEVVVEELALLALVPGQVERLRDAIDEWRQQRACLCTRERAAFFPQPADFAPKPQRHLRQPIVGRRIARAELREERHRHHGTTTAGLTLACWPFTTTTTR